MSIQSDVITGSYVRLFIPMNYHASKRPDQFCAVRTAVLEKGWHPQWIEVGLYDLLDLTPLNYQIKD